MIPPPPTSTLFPYTTLFRSLFERPPVVAPLQEEPVLGVRPVDRMPQHHEELRGRQHRRDPRRALDRKSTRLNSSHQIISYAVFCLKKKHTTIAPALLQLRTH